jgi:hypothetical protein
MVLYTSVSKSEGEVEMREFLLKLIGKTIIDINDYPNSPGIIIIFSDGTTLTLETGAFGGLHAEIDEYILPAKEK